jgi:RNA polymerase sigma factor (TIGR02999 family)
MVVENGRRMCPAQLIQPVIQEWSSNRLMTDDLHRLLEAAAQGDASALDRAFALLYDELSVLARAQRRRWQGNETLNTTVLVHEAYLKVAGAGQAVRWEGRRHFFALAARAMRQILVNYAEAQRAAKRGGDEVRLSLESSSSGDATAEIGLPQEADHILAVHEALEQLSQQDPRQARIVECRFFVGMSIPETAEALGISPATVKRDWQLASAWLYQVLKPTGD